MNRLHAAWLAFRDPHLTGDGLLFEALAIDLAFSGQLAIVTSDWEDGHVPGLIFHMIPQHEQAAVSELVGIQP